MYLHITQEDIDNSRAAYILKKSRYNTCPIYQAALRENLHPECMTSVLVLRNSRYYPNNKALSFMRANDTEEVVKPCTLRFKKITNKKN